MSLSRLLTPAVVLLLAATSLSPERPVRASGPFTGGGSPPAAAPGTPAASVSSRALDAEATDVGATHPAALRPRSAWAWPLSPQPGVVRRFIAPQSRWGAGHRGVDLAGHLGQPVHAVAAGTVSHVGVVAGRGTVSVLHPSGIRSTYEPVDPSVRVGQLVGQGAILGVLGTAGSHCVPAACLHLGALRGESYLDPLLLLVGGRVRLLPMR